MRYVGNMRFSVLFLMLAVFGFAAFGVLGMTMAMEHGHGFCFAASAGPLCPETISAFISHLTNFQKIFVSILREIFVFAFAAIWCIALFLLPHRNYLRFAFSFRTERIFLLRFAVAKEKFLSWLAFHEQSPASFLDA